MFGIIISSKDGGSTLRRSARLDYLAYWTHMSLSLMRRNRLSEVWSRSRRADHSSQYWSARPMQERIS